MVFFIVLGTGLPFPVLKLNEGVYQGRKVKRRLLVGIHFLV